MKLCECDCNCGNFPAGPSHYCYPCLQGKHLDPLTQGGRQVRRSNYTPPGRCPHCMHAKHLPGPCTTPSENGCRECEGGD